VNPAGLSVNKKSELSKFVIFSIILFLVIVVLGSISFVFSMQQIIKTNRSNELSQILETERIWLESSLKSELAIALKLSTSPLIKKYLLDPGDPELEKIALEEIASYRDAFSGYSIFWMNDIDRIFYSDDNEPYWVDADDPVNYWYNLTLHETEIYNFNINYNPDINEIKLWINAPVFDDDLRSIGMVGTGIELSEFVDAVYAAIDERTELYFFAADGKIYGARDVGLIIDRANIADVLRDIDIDIYAEAENLEPETAKLLDITNGIVAIGYIPLPDWRYIAITTYSIADYDPAMTMLFIAMLLLILIIIIIFNVFIARFLRSLREASESLAAAAKTREQELIADNDMLDRMNRMKNEFFQNMSHDFKTPLTVISTSVLNAADMLDFKMDKEEMRESLDNAQREIMRMARMVDGAMKQSSMYDNRQDMKPLDPAPLLREEAIAYRALLERNGNALSLDIPRSLPQIYGNSDMLLLVLSNLFSNANRYTRGGNIAMISRADKDMVIVTVLDDGMGIEPELLPRVFERGVSDSGTGLGLAICKTAIESHNGTITIESEYGKGTAVTFTLPVYKPDEEAFDEEQ